MTATATLDAPAPEAPESAATTGGFVHLHVHTEFSKQDGLGRLGDMLAHIKADGQPAIASTDHGNIAGAWKFHQAAKKAGIKPVIGIETYMALVPDGEDGSTAMAWDDPRVRFAKHSREEPDAESGNIKKNTNNHLTILVRNEAGWRNLCRITNAAEDSFWSKPLIDYALLKEHGEGLIVLTGCLGGPVASRVAMSNMSRREADAIRARIAGRDSKADDETQLAVLAQTMADLRPEALIARNLGADATAEQADTLAMYLHAKRSHDDLAARLAETDATDTSADEARLARLDADADRELDAARANLDHLIECVGRENVYVEIMEHGMSAEGRDHIKVLTMLADEAGVPIVATNDSHYVGCDDHDAHDAWLASGTGKLKNDPNRWRFNGTGYHLRTEAEMRALYSGKRWQQACDETVRIAERIEDDVIPYVALRLPKFPVPAAHVAKWEATGPSVEDRRYKTASAFYLHHLVLKGAKERYDALTPELKERLAFEEGVITGMGLEDYFLIVGDVLEWARSDRGYPTAEYPEGKPGEKKPILVGPGRGSAAGSAISYAMWIVMVEPLSNGLLFERFLDPTRLGMPDIDVDFEAARRDEVYTYLAARYGEEYIARIGAFQVAKTKRAIKDAARVLNLAHVADKMTKLVPVHQGKPQSFAMLFEEELDKETKRPKPNPEAQDFRDFVASDPQAAEVVALARKFEDVTAGESIHAAGVIISDEPLPSLIPMRRLRDKKGEQVGVPVALWDGKDIDDFGMLKLDALSLRNLDIVAAAADHIKDTTDEVVNPDLLPDPDSKGNERVDKSFALLRDGRTSGIFQLESSGITELTELIAPTEFNDLSALVALYRPGPMGDNQHTLYADRKNDRVPTENAWTRIPAERAVIDDIVGDTYLTIAYQEQMMVLAERVAGFDMGEKNKLRKAFSKKDRPAMEALKDIFISRGQTEMTLADGTRKIAFTPATLNNLWRTFDASAEYLFNKSHSAAYGYLAYVTAYFKANWPTEYGAGILGVTDKADKRLPVLYALAQEGIEVMGPDVNLSRAKTAPDLANPKAVRLGLTEIRDVGNNGKWIAHERETNGDFTSMHDVMRRVKVPGPTGELTAKLSVTAVEGLIEAGAFDSLGLPRLGLMLAMRATTPDYAAEVPDAEWSVLEQSTRQRIRLGVALGNHPMKAYRDTLRDYVFNEREDRFGNPIGGRPAPLHKVAELPKGNMITIGVLTSWAERTTRNGGKMANFTIEGTKASMPGTVFNDAIRDMRKNGTTPQVGDIIGLAGQVKTRTVTSIEIDPETGEEVEETREVRELIGSFLEVVPVDTTPVFDLPEVSAEERVDLVSAIARGRVRAAEMVEEKKAAAAEARVAKKAASASASATTRKKAAPVPAAPLLIDPETVEFTDEDLAAPVQASLFEVGEPVAEPLPVRRDVDASRPWAAAILCRNGIGPLSDSKVIRDGVEVDDAKERAELRETFLLGNRKKHEPTATSTAHDTVFRVAGGCFGKCCSTCHGRDTRCIHHGGTESCSCTKGCQRDAAAEGTYLLLVVTGRGVDGEAYLGDIVMESDAWVEFGDESPGWASAPLSAFVGASV